MLKYSSHLAAARAGALLALLVLLALPAVADAALGEPAASVPADSVRFKASVRVLGTSAAYTVHELSLPTGTVVHEFLNSAGTVFAVSWRGPFMPDLQALLGRYFATYASAPRSTGSNRTHLAIDAGNLVMRASGHQRAFSGLAYLPQLLPAGLSAGELQ